MFQITDNEWNAIKLSMVVTGTSTIMLIPVSLLLGWYLARKKNRFNMFFEVVLHLPQVLPPVVTGLLLLSVFGKNALGGKLIYALTGLYLPFTTAGVILVSMVVSFPIMLGFFKSAFQMVDQKYEEAAQTLGYSKFMAVIKFTVPMARPGILSGIVLAFARSLGEFGATITFAGSIQGSTQTIPLAIYSAFQSFGTENSMWRLVIISVVISTLALIIANRYKNSTA